jgi:hypothetical protein
LRKDLRVLNGDLKKIILRTGDGKIDWDKTLQMRSERAQEIIKGQNLEGSHRFSWIRGLIEERMI